MLESFESFEDINFGCFQQLLIKLKDYRATKQNLLHEQLHHLSEHYCTTYLVKVKFTQIGHRSVSDLNALNRALTVQFCKSPFLPSASSQCESERRLIALII